MVSVCSERLVFLDCFFHPLRNRLKLDHAEKLKTCLCYTSNHPVLLLKIELWSLTTYQWSFYSVSVNFTLVIAAFAAMFHCYRPTSIFRFHTKLFGFLRSQILGNRAHPKCRCMPTFSEFRAFTWWKIGTIDCSELTKRNHCSSDAQRTVTAQQVAEKTLWSLRLRHLRQ